MLSKEQVEEWRDGMLRSLPGETQDLAEIARLRDFFNELCDAAIRSLESEDTASKRWYEAASPYATPGALKEALRSLDAGWVSCKDRLPEKTSDVCVCYHAPSKWTPARRSCTRQDDLHSEWWRVMHDVTHWCPLPAAPSAQRDG